MNVLVLDRLLVNHFKLFFIAKVPCYYKHVFCIIKSIQLVFLKKNQSIRRKLFLRFGSLSLCNVARILRHLLLSEAVVVVHLLSSSF